MCSDGVYRAACSGFRVLLGDLRGCVLIIGQTPRSLVPGLPGCPYTTPSPRASDGLRSVASTIGIFGKIH